MNKKITEFREYRQKMNKKLLAADNLIIKRIFNLDANTYRDGALSAREKELLGLVASLVLRCDDCVKYHLEQCFAQLIQEGKITREAGLSYAVNRELIDVFLEF